MAHSDVVTTIEAHIRAVFPHCLVFGEDEETETPTDGSAFLVVSFPYATSNQATIGAPGANYWQEEGAFVATLALPRGGGVRQGRQWLDDLATTFRGKDIGSVRCAAPQPAVLDDDRDDSAHVRLMMSVPYRYWVTG